MGTQARADFEDEDDTYGDFIRSESRPEQIDWCNEYNSLIREKVGPRYEDTQYYGITFMTTINLIENVLLQT